MYKAIPYVYIIKNKSTNLKYLGVRYANGCDPSDLWVTYFTSSKLVHKLIESFGRDDFYVKILHIFPNNPEKAILREAKYFPFIKKRNDYLNICYSSGIQDLRICSKAGKVGGAIVKSKNIGIFRDYNERKIWSILGGKSSWESKNNVEFKYWASKEGRLKRSSLGGSKGNFTIECLMKKYSCSEENAKLILQKQQADRGKKGGIKNAGFKWYNDGLKEYKYTVLEQKNINFEEFLEKNKNYAKGRLKNENKKNN